MTRRRRGTSPRQSPQASAARLEVWESDYPSLGDERPQRDLLAAFVIDATGQVTAEWHSELFQREVELHGIAYGGRVLRPDDGPDFIEGLRHAFSHSTLRYVVEVPVSSTEKEVKP